MKKSKPSRPARGRRGPPWTAPLEPRALTASNAPPDNLGLPDWLPVAALPPLARPAAAAIAAAYRRFVLEAPDELARAVGASMVQLMWLDLVNQGRLAAALADPGGVEAILHDTEHLTDRSLELVAAKSETAELLLKIRVTDDMAKRLAALPALEPPALEPPAGPRRTDFLIRPERLTDVPDPCLETAIDLNPGKLDGLGNPSYGAKPTQQSPQVELEIGENANG